MESSLTPFFLPHLVFNASRNVSAGLCVQNLAISHHSHCDHHGPCLSCELRQSPPPGLSSSRLSRLCLNTEASIKTQVRSRSFSPQNHSSSPCVTGSTFLSCPRLLFLSPFPHSSCSVVHSPKAIAFAKILPTTSRASAQSQEKTHFSLSFCFIISSLRQKVPHGISARGEKRPRGIKKYKMHRGKKHITQLTFQNIMEARWQYVHPMVKFLGSIDYKSWQHVL